MNGAGIIPNGSPVGDAIARFAPTVSRDKLGAVIRKIVTERAEFVVQNQKGAFGPLMGVMMQEVRESVDGKKPPSSTSDFGICKIWIFRFF
jgi:glutamyl-tRNA(Gln) amidotransferase subunit E